MFYLVNTTRTTTGGCIGILPRLGMEKQTDKTMRTEMETRIIYTNGNLKAVMRPRVRITRSTAELLPPFYRNTRILVGMFLLYSTHILGGVTVRIPSPSIHLFFRKAERLTFIEIVQELYKTCISWFPLSQLWS